MQKNWFWERMIVFMKRCTSPNISVIIISEKVL